MRTAVFSRLVWLIAAILLVSACQAQPPAHQFNGTPLDPPLSIPDFELAATNGQPFHLSDVRGRYALVYFGYTFCPDVCPLTLSDVRTALDGLEGRERVQVIFISVDPERDTPEVLARYLRAFDPTFIGLTDDFARTQAVMKHFGAFAEKEEVPDSAAGYLVSHTARLYLLNPDGRVILTYPFGFEPEDLRADLEYLLQEDPQ